MTKHTPVERSLDELVTDMQKECELLWELERDEREASNRVTSCRNSVNILQRTIDNRVKKLREREDVPYDSDSGTGGKGKPDE